jgi:hypothetical protein
MTDKSTWGKLWESAGGEYTPEEREIFRNSDIPESEPAISRDMAQRIANSDKAGRQEILNKHLEGLNSIHDQLAEATNATEVMPLRNEGQTLGFGASTGISLLSGLAADKLVGLGESLTGKTIDDKRDFRTGLVGGLGAMGIGALAGESVAAPELAAAGVIGAGASIMGKEASKLAAKAGAGKFGQAEAGGTAAGATAGLGTALAAGALGGAEAGVPLDAETLGMASVVGAGIGAGFSALGYGLSKLGINI